MASFAFTQQVMIWMSVYFAAMLVIFALFFFLWKRQADDVPIGRKRNIDDNFFVWFFFNSQTAWVNWAIVIIFLFNVYRLIATIIYGYSPD